MTETFDKLKALLEKQGTLSNEEVEKMVAESGALTDDEKLWLSAEQHKQERSKKVTVTMDDYLAALKVLDTAAEGTEEYKKAEATVTTYESGG